MISFLPKISLSVFFFSSSHSLLLKLRLLVAAAAWLCKLLLSLFYRVVVFFVAAAAAASLAVSCAVLHLEEQQYHYSMEDHNESSGRTSSFAVLLLAASCLLLGCLAALRRWRNAADPPLPPGPQGFPFIGYLPFLGECLHRDFAKLSKTYGPIFKLRLGRQLWVVLSSPSLTKEITRDHDIVFANRDITVAGSTLTFGGKNLAFADYGPYWRKMRRVYVQDLMSSSTLDACSSLRREEVKKSIRSLYNKAGTAVDVGEVSAFLLISVVMAMLWGHSVKGEKRESLNLEFRKKAAELMVLLGKPNVSDFFPGLARFDIQGMERDTKKIRQWIHNFLDSIIEGAVDKRAKVGTEDAEEVGDDERKKDIVQIFLELQSEQSSTTNEELKAILTETVIAGTDTTSTMVEWAMAELLLHKAVFEKAVEELTEVVGTNNTVQECHLPKLTYLDAVIKETLRLHPAVALLVPRSPSHSVAVGGYTIPKGSKVFVNVWSIQRDPQLWENPLEFKPERFLENPGVDFSGHNFTYLPFGSGRRICAGIPLGEKMLKYVLASFLHSFDWELPDGANLELSDKFGIVVKIAKPLVAIPRPRLSKPELYE